MKKARTVIAMALSLALVCMAGGCAIFQRGPSDEELLKDFLCTFETAVNGRDVDTLISLHSKDFVGSNGENYEQAVAGLREIVPQFDNLGIEVSTAETNIEIEGKKAQLSLIAFKTNFGDMAMTLCVAKEDDGVWRMISSETQE